MRKHLNMLKEDMPIQRLYPVKILFTGLVKIGALTDKGKSE